MSFLPSPSTSATATPSARKALVICVFSNWTSAPAAARSASREAASAAGQGVFMACFCTDGRQQHGKERPSISRSLAERETQPEEDEAGDEAQEDEEEHRQGHRHVVGTLARIPGTATRIGLDP